MTTTVDMGSDKSERLLGDTREEAFQGFVRCRNESIDILKLATQKMETYKNNNRFMLVLKIILPIVIFVFITYFAGIIIGFFFAIVISGCCYKLGASKVISNEIGKRWNQILQNDNQALAYYTSFLRDKYILSYQTSSKVFTIFGSIVKDAMQIAYYKLRATQPTDALPIDDQHVDPIPVLLGIVTVMSNDAAMRMAPTHEMAEELRQLTYQMEQELVILRIKHCKKQLALLLSWNW